jgi:hybrid cluster-associated redox disulfide protein
MNPDSYIGVFMAKKSNSNPGSVGGSVKKTDVLGEVIDKYPEVAPILGQAGLHCIGCHVSAYESIVDGCLAHGMSEKDVDELVKKANKRISEYNKLPQLIFTQKAVLELEKRLGKGSGRKKFIRLVQNFGEFDFDAVESKETDEFVVEAVAGEKKVSVLLLPRIERMLRGVRVDFDSKKKDFVAVRI